MEIKSNLFSRCIYIYTYFFECYEFWILGLNFVCFEDLTKYDCAAKKSQGYIRNILVT